MPTLFMTQGLPASGKTTWAKKYQSTLGAGKVTRVNKDDLRAMMDNGQWSKDNEKLVLEVRDSIIIHALRRGRHIIVDDTNLDPKHEKALRELASTERCTFELVSFTQLDGKTVEETYEICLERNAERCGASRVPDKVIKEMYERYLALPPAKPPEYNPNLPDCILVDIDGTMALRNGRGPFDWAKVGEDAPNQQVVSLVQSFLHNEDCDVIFVSGRDEICRTDTETWLDRVVDGRDPNLLYMRPQGDTRDDRIVKREMYEREVKGKYNVRFVLDDRDKVVKMWRQLGLTCLQVAEGNF